MGDSDGSDTGDDDEESCKTYIVIGIIVIEGLHCYTGIELLGSETPTDADTAEFHPFPSKLAFLLYILLHSPHPTVRQKHEELCPMKMYCIYRESHSSTSSYFF